jgi:tungstate transport system ATP-binding protein
VIQPKLSLRDVRVARRGGDILQVPHLDVFPGEVLAVIGPNGAGKSTLLVVLALLERPSQGQVLFEGESVRGRELSLRRRMAVVFQETMLLRRSLVENVATGLALRGVRRREREERALHWMARFGIAHLARRGARNLSGGESQRASLARAFVLEPEVFLLDEAFNGLDQPTREVLLEELAGVLAETGVTAVFVTHDRDEAARLGNRVAVLLGGRLRQVGSPAEVFGAPVDEEVAAFVGVETVVPGRAVGGDAGLARIEVAGRVIEVVPKGPLPEDVLVCLRPEDVVLAPPDGAVPSSARNRLPGTVTRILPAGAQARVTVDCGFPLVSVITRQSLEELRLEVGARVVASFKASAVHLIPRSRGSWPQT